MVVPYSIKGDTFEANRARVWLTNYGGLASSGGFDLSPDGKRLVAVMPVEAAGSPKTDHEVVFVEHFFDELRRKATANAK